ncbi:MAG: restriction endonuclease subunit S [Anaerolineaceae bacterium]|nr:restriction endonuclease subunit S [Anaerolineaceae bacterium]
MNNKKSLLTTVLFSSMQQWDVKRFFLSQIKSKFAVEELGKHLIHQTEKINLSDYPDKDFIILGVSTKIGMFDAITEKGRKIKQKYHFVKDNWIAYNPYRINVGSIGIKTPDLKGEYISPAYIVFSCKDTLLPEFLWLMMKSRYFNTLIRDSTTGSVRQTLHYENLAAIKAPIPSIPEQQEILTEYHAALAMAEDNIEKGSKFSEGLLLDIQSEVSNLKKQNTQKSSETGSILQIVPFTSTRRWEVGYILKEGRLDNVYRSFKYKSYNINDLKTETLFGLSVKASPTKKKGMIPVLRMSNIVNGKIDFSELKYLPLKCAIADKEPDKWLLRDGDFLVTRTNGSKELIGKAAVFHSTDIYTYASYLIRYRFDTTIVLPEYMNIMFMTPLVREQIAVMRRQGGGQYNLNSDEIGKIRIPVPSIPEQQAIISKYYSAKDGSNIYYDKAHELRKKAALNFEKAIFWVS